jgi:hypothetical protein
MIREERRSISSQPLPFHGLLFKTIGRLFEHGFCVSSPLVGTIFFFSLFEMPLILFPQEHGSTSLSAFVFTGQPFRKHFICISKL